MVSLDNVVVVAGYRACVLANECPRHNRQVTETIKKMIKKVEKWGKRSIKMNEERIKKIDD